MAITKFNTRVQLKFDTWANWNSTTGKAFIPLKGEVCICEIPADTAATGEVLTEKAYLIKVGDGTTTFGSLPWLSAPAADVHAWAKKSYDDIVTELDKTFATDEALTELVSEVGAIDGDLDAHLKDFSNPHKVTKSQVDLGNVTNNKQVKALSSSKVDSIIAFSSTDGCTIKDTGVTIKILQDATSAADTKADNAASVANLAAAAADDAQQTADSALEQTNTNKDNITKIVNGTTTVGKATSATSASSATKATQDGSGNNIVNTYATKSSLITTNENLTDVTSRTVTLEGYFDGGKAKQAIKDGSGNNIANTYATKTELNNLSTTIGDLANVMNFKGLVTTDPTTITTGYNDGDVVLYNNKEYVFSDDAFHEFGDTSTVNQAITDLSSVISGLRYFSAVKAGTTTLTPDKNSGEVLNVAGGTAIIVTGTDTSGTETMTIAHSNVSCTKGTTSTLTPAHEGTFNIIESVTVNGQGHVTAYQPRTIQLPSVDDLISRVSAIETNYKSYATITGTSGTTTAATINNGLAIVGDTKNIKTTVSTDKVTISHIGPDTTVVDRGTTRDTTSTAAPAHKGTFTAVDSVSTDATGHVIGVNTKTVTLPSVDTINSNIAAINSYSSVAADSGTACTATSKNEKITISGGTKLTSLASNSSTAGSDKITINHDATTRTDTTSKTSPNHSGTFTVVDSITSDSTGHITAANIKTVTLPAKYDDSNVKSRLTALEGKVWATTPVTTVANGATTVQLGALAKSSLTIGSSSIAYIIFDCGSATENI